MVEVKDKEEIRCSIGLPATRKMEVAWNVKYKK